MKNKRNAYDFVMYPSWKKISDGFPNFNEKVLIYTESYGVVIAIRIKTTDYYWSWSHGDSEMGPNFTRDEVKYWLSLPPKPVEYQ